MLSFLQLQKIVRRDIEIYFNPDFALGSLCASEDRCKCKALRGLFREAYRDTLNEIIPSITQQLRRDSLAQ